MIRYIFVVTNPIEILWIINSTESAIHLLRKIFSLPIGRERVLDRALLDIN